MFRVFTECSECSSRRAYGGGCRPHTPAVPLRGASLPPPSVFGVMRGVGGNAHVSVLPTPDHCLQVRAIRACCCARFAAFPSQHPTVHIAMCAQDLSVATRAKGSSQPFLVRFSGTANEANAVSLAARAQSRTHELLPPRGVRVTALRHAYAFTRWLRAWSVGFETPAIHLELALVAPVTLRATGNGENGERCGVGLVRLRNAHPCWRRMRHTRQ